MEQSHKVGQKRMPQGIYTKESSRDATYHTYEKFFGECLLALMEFMCVFIMSFSFVSDKEQMIVKCALYHVTSTYVRFVKNINPNSHSHRLFRHQCVFLVALSDSPYLPPPE